MNLPAQQNATSGSDDLASAFKSANSARGQIAAIGLLTSAKPRAPEHEHFLQELLHYVEEQEASGQVFIVQPLSEAVEQDILARFRADRDREYDEFKEQCQVFLSEILAFVIRPGSDRYPPDKQHGRPVWRSSWRAVGDSRA